MNDALESVRRAVEAIPAPHPDPERVRRAARRRSTVRRITAGGVALVVAAAGTAFVVSALREAGPRPATPGTERPLEPTTLSYAWSVRIENASAVGEVLQDADRVYVPTATGAVAYTKDCTDPCRPVWTLDVLGAGDQVGVATSTLALGDGVLAVNVAGRLATVATDCAEGGSACQPLWFADPIPGASGYVGPVVADGVVKVTTNLGDAPDNLHTAVAFELRCRQDGGECSPLWQAELGSGAAHVPGAGVGDVFYQQVGMRMLGFTARCRTDRGTCEPDFVVESTGDPQTQQSSLYGPVLHDGTLVLASGVGTLAGYPLHCGTSCEAVWMTEVADYVEAHPFLAGDVVVIGHEGGVTAVPLACGDSRGEPCAPAWRAELDGYWTVEYADAGAVVAASRFRSPKRIAVLPASCADPCKPMWTAEMSGELNGVGSDGTTVFASNGRRVLAFPVACSDPCAPVWNAGLEETSWGFLVDERTLVVTSQLGGLGAMGIGVTVYEGQPDGSPEGAATQAAASGTECVQTTTSGDFDGDGTMDEAKVIAVVPADVSCARDGDVYMHMESQRIEVGFGSGQTLDQPLTDCQPCLTGSLVFAATDLDGDGRDELAIDVGPGAATDYMGFHRVDPSGISALVVSEPGDPPYVEPGPAVLGGGFDSGQWSPIQCRVAGDGTRELVSVHAENLTGPITGPWRVHTTTMVLEGDRLVVTSTTDLESDDFTRTADVFQNGCS